MKLLIILLLFIAFFHLVFVQSAFAYIGPGAGFAVISSFFILFVTFILAFFTLFTLPVRMVVLSLKRRKTRRQRRVKRAVILGLDGFDPVLCQKYMNEGKLPNFQALAQQGTFRPLLTTTPSISPAAWSTFATGVNPGKHRIFDFLTRHPQTYLPMLSSARIETNGKTVKIGPWRIQLNKPHAQLLRRSVPFWSLLGEKKIFSTILRVPVTFPPEKFYGACLAAMCTPDLTGTQGTFTLFTTDKGYVKTGALAGRVISLELQNDRFRTEIAGPALRNNGTETTLVIPVEGRVDRAQRTVELKIREARYLLHEGKYSPWIKLIFRAGKMRRVCGIVRLLVTHIEPNLQIYMTPINIDPEKPALPISHPYYYAVYAAKMQGPFATLGLAEDTGALNERVIDEGQFLEQAYDIYEERRRLFLDTLVKSKNGPIVFVFDTTDRIQHMFFRYLSSDHPANPGKDRERYKDAIEELYVKMDDLISEVVRLLKGHELLMVISDHGFKPFKWGVNLNGWLRKEGYLVLKDGVVFGDEWLADVDWTRTRAYALGLTGIYINTRGREASGIVNPGEEKDLLIKEIKEKLETLCSPKHNRPVRRAITAGQALSGPYVSEAPDLIIGYAEGYRVSWNSARGRVTEELFEDNTRSWSGDHSIDPELVPGVFFSNWMLKGELPSLQDIAPTILHLFGLKKPLFQDGRILDLDFPAARAEKEQKL